jgi:hypothetical protein
MSSVIISGDTSGAVTVAAPAVAGTNTLTLQAATATNSVNTLATSVATTSGTSIDFTGLPSWVKKITVMFAGVSTNGSSNFLVQIGYQSPVTSTGYVSGSTIGTTSSFSTAGMVITTGAAGNTWGGIMTLATLGSNVWVATHGVGRSIDGGSSSGGGNVTLSGTLDRVRITTVNGTDTFDAGTINILYEG